MSSNDTWFKTSLRGRIAEISSYMKKVLIILIIILFIPTIVFSEETAPDSSKNNVNPPDPQNQEANPANNSQPDQNEKEAKVTTSTEETVSNEPSYKNIYILQLSGNYMNLKTFKDSPKAKEYRTIPEGFYIDNLLFFLGSEHQEFSGNSGKVYPMTNISEDGYWNLSYRRYGLLDIDTGRNKFIHEYGAASTAVSTNRDINNLMFKFTPEEHLIISTRLSVEDRNGKRPLTVESFTEPNISPTAVIETTEPTDYRITTIGIGMEYIDNNVDIQFDNSYQIFTNNLTDAVSWTNPYNGSDGKAKVAGDYTVHTLTFKPSIKLTDNIKSINTLSYSKVTSSIDLIPFTTTSGASDNFLTNTVDTDVRSLTFSTMLSAKLFSNSSFNAKFRHYAYKNDTPALKETPPYVMIDGGTDAKRYPRIPVYTDYYTDSIVLDGTWSPVSRVLLNTSIENNDTSRNEREVKKQNEKKASISLRSTMFNSLSGKIGYQYLRRRGNYDPTYYNAVYNTDPSNNLTQHTLLRTFDLSELDSQKVSAGMDYFPVEVLTLGVNLSYINDNHLNVSVGRGDSKTTSGSAYIQLAPFKGLQVYSEYYYDVRKTRGKYAWTYDSSLSYPQDPQNPGFTEPVNESLNDTSNVYVTGFDFVPHEAVSITGKYCKYDFSGTDTNLPEVSNVTDTYEINISYKFKKEYGDMKITAGYYMENYKRIDYTLDNFPDAGTDIFLGVREPDYKFRLISLYASLYF